MPVHRMPRYCPPIQYKSIGLLVGTPHFNVGFFCFLKIHPFVESSRVVKVRLTIPWAWIHGFLFGSISRSESCPVIRRVKFPFTRFTLIKLGTHQPYDGIFIPCSKVHENLSDVNRLDTFRNLTKVSHYEILSNSSESNRVDGFDEQPCFVGQRCRSNKCYGIITKKRCTCEGICSVCIVSY